MVDDAKTLKPKLTIDEQIEHLKAKGVLFERCSEPEAVAYLTDVNYYFRVTAYRTLFEKRVRSEKLKNPRVQQIITALYLYAKTFDLDDPDGDIRKGFDCFDTRVRGFIDALPRNNASDVLRSFFEFLLAAFDKWL